MSIDNTSKLIEVKNNVLRTEKAIAEILNQLPRNKSIQAGRCKDYGERTVTINVPIDELNIEVFSDANVKLIRTLYTQFKNLRVNQKQLEEVYDSNNYPANELRQDLNLKLRS